MKIDPKYIRAAAPFCAAKDIRYYLKGILFDFNDRGELRLVASDGSVFCAVGTDTVEPDMAGIRVIFDAGLCAELGKSKVPLEISKAGDEWKIGDRVCSPIEGTYPQWQRLLPDFNDLGEFTPCTFYPAFLKPLELASKALTRSANSCVFRQRGVNGLLAVIPGQKFVGIVMPLREPANFEIKAGDFAWL